ncbi:uncharacterized protein [Miscanthus floridulus]|uniref:uncharacterized protein isoform X2 n=1 Tax=Miscanthus floridulus TaxID=154761 RepID=UPI0034577D38
MPSPSPAAVLVSNGAIAPHAPPSAAAFLDSTPGAYTTARGTLLLWPRHLRRLTESAALLARSHPHLLGLPLPLPLPRSRALDLDFLSIQSLVNPSVRVAIHEMHTRLPVTKDEHLALTALVRGAGAGADSISGSWDGLDVFVHVGTYAPPVFGESGARLAVAGRGRDAAAAKYASWARTGRERRNMREGHRQAARWSTAPPPPPLASPPRPPRLAGARPGLAGARPGLAGARAESWSTVLPPPPRPAHRGRPHSPTQPGVTTPPSPPCFQ